MYSCAGSTCWCTTTITLFSIAFALILVCVAEHVALAHLVADGGVVKDNFRSAFQYQTIYLLRAGLTMGQIRQSA